MYLCNIRAVKPLAGPQNSIKSASRDVITFLHLREATVGLRCTLLPLVGPWRALWLNTVPPSLQSQVTRHCFMVLSVWLSKPSHLTDEPLAKMSNSTGL